MKTKKTTLLYTETHEALSVRLNFGAQPRRAPVLCEVCAAQSPLLTPEEAAPRAGLSVRAVCRLVEDGLLHFKEMPDGLLLVCPSNLNGRGPDSERADA